MRSRFRLCKFCGDMHQLGKWPHNCLPDAPARSDFPSPYVISDSLGGGVNGLYHHAALRSFDSKHAYRRATRENGCIEIGNERDAYDKQQASERDRPMAKDVIESAVNESLHQLGISSESDMGSVDYGVT